MTLASIKADQKQQKIDPKNKNLLSKFFDIGQMEFLELYESCVQFDPTRKKRKEDEDLKDDYLMKNKIDFQKRYMCEFGNLQSEKERISTSSAQLLLNFNDRKDIVKFSKI